MAASLRDTPCQFGKNFLQIIDMATHALEAESLDIVLVGSLNPAIFHPQWLLRHELISTAAADAAVVKMVSHEIAEIRFADIRLICIPERLVLSTADPARYEEIHDLVLCLLKLLPHTPLRACGVNPSVQYRLGSVEYWHRIGHTLAPKDLIWDGLFETPGLQTLRIKAPRGGEFPGEVNVTVEPSPRFHPGILVTANTHFAVKDDDQPLRGADKVGGFLSNDWESACAEAKRVADTILSKIRFEDA